MCPAINKNDKSDYKFCGMWYKYECGCCIRCVENVCDNVRNCFRDTCVCYDNKILRCQNICINCCNYSCGFSTNKLLKCSDCCFDKCINYSEKIEDKITNFKN